ATPLATISLRTCTTSGSSTCSVGTSGYRYRARTCGRQPTADPSGTPGRSPSSAGGRDGLEGREGSCPSCPSCPSSPSGPSCPSCPLVRPFGGPLDVRNHQCALLH